MTTMRKRPWKVTKRAKNAELATASKVNNGDMEILDVNWSSLVKLIIHYLSKRTKAIRFSC